MDPEENKGEENKGAEDKGAESTPDQFGVNLDSKGVEVSTEEPKDGEDGGVTDADVSGVIKDEIDNSDVVTELQNKVADYSKNLKGQKDVIVRLENKIDELSKNNGAPKVDELFKDIKMSKDLTSEQREEMTDTEIALMDQNATTQKAMNKMYQSLAEKNKAGEDEKVENLNYSSRSEATKLATEAIKANPELAGSVSELTDKILLEFKEFNNDQITPDVLVSRMSKALNNVKGYVAPKEQETVGTGGTNAVKSGGADEKDPFGNDIIVEEANKSNDGNYKL